MLLLINWSSIMKRYTLITIVIRETVYSYNKYEQSTLESKGSMQFDMLKYAYSADKCTKISAKSRVKKLTTNLVWCPIHSSLICRSLRLFNFRIFCHLIPFLKEVLARHRCPSQIKLEFPCSVVFLFRYSAACT